jgi:hypothetical protein
MTLAITAPAFKANASAAIADPQLQGVLRQGLGFVARRPARIAARRRSTGCRSSMRCAIPPATSRTTRWRTSIFISKPTTSGCARPAATCIMR